MRAGIDLGGTKIEGLALDHAGTVAARRRIPAPQGDYRATVTAVRGLVDDLETAAGPVTHVGVGIPGTPSPTTGLIKNANSTWLIGHPFGRDLENALGRPVRLANDANCFAVSEAADGAAEGADVVFGVILGTGVGGGIAINGRPVTGRNAIAGEWGHNPLPWPRDDERPGARCYCGLEGCIETFLSGPALARDHLAATGADLTPPAIAAQAAAGDPGAEASLTRYEDRLARALATVVNILDPDVIVLGGGLSNLERLYVNVPRLWGQWVFSDDVTTRLVPPRHGDASGVRGAAWLWPAEISSRP
jgi:fructokinase